jgi:hypothetical protein
LEALGRGGFANQGDHRFVVEHDVFGVGVAGNQDDGDVLGRNLLGGGQAIHYRHVKVGEHDIDLARDAPLDQLLAIDGHAHDAVAERLEQSHERLPHGRVVFGHGNSDGGDRWFVQIVAGVREVWSARDFVHLAAP